MTTRHLLTESLDDYGPMVALAVRRPDLGLVPSLRAPGSPLPASAPAVSMHEFLASADADVLALWRHLQQLWHRWAAPLDSFNPVRWYLTALADGPHRAVHAAVDRQLQVLGQAASGRLEAAARLLGREDRGAVLGWGAPEWSLPGMLLAARTGRTFLWVPTAADAVRAAADWPGPLTLCFPHDEVTVEEVLRLSETRSFTGPGRLAGGLRLASRPLGFLTATSLDVLSGVVGRQLAADLPLPSTTASVFTGLDTDPQVGEDAYLLNRERSSAGYLEAVGDVSALFLSGHSREDLFHLGPDVLCGRSLRATGEGVRQPACVLDGRCVKDGEILPAHRLSAPVAFFNSCNVMRLGGDGAFDAAFTLPFTFQEGRGIAAVGSRRTRFGDDNVELGLAERLLRTGRTMGETVRLLNGALPLWGREAPDYLLLGDAEFTPFAPGPDTARATVSTAADGATQAVFTGVEAELLEVRLPGAGSDPAVRVVEAVGEDGAPVHVDLRSALVPESDGGLRLFVFSWQTLRLASLTLRIEASRPHQDLVADTGQALRNATAYRRLLRSCLSGFDNAEQELRSQATALSRRRAEARTAPLGWQDADSTAQELRRQIGRLDTALCGSLLDRIHTGAFVLLEQYESVDGTFHVSRHLPATTCPYCEQRVVVREYRHEYQPEVRREFALCASCGNVWDTAEGTHPPVALGEEVALRGSEHAQGVRVTNTQDRPLRGAVGLRLYQAAKHGVAVTPEVRDVEVPPHSSREFWFTLKLPDQIPAHMEFLRGFLVSNLGVSVFQRNLWIRPAAGADRPEAEEPGSTVAPVWPPTGTVLSQVVAGRRQ